MKTSTTEYSAYTDQELVTLLKQTDKAAYTEIYERYAMMIYYKVNQMLRDEESAKDLVQDVFTTLWSRADSIHHADNLAGFLYIAAKNRVFKLIEKGRVRNDYLASIASYITESTDETAEVLDERELMGIVAQEIAKLPEKMRAVFELSRIENLSHREIAGRLGISEKTVKTQVHNALTILRTRLSDYGSYSIIILALFRGDRF